MILIMPLSDLFGLIEATSKAGTGAEASAAIAGARLG
jgi:hypothetical protein